jgi:hypothetical protein
LQWIFGSISWRSSRLCVGSLYPDKAAKAKELIFNPIAEELGKIRISKITAHVSQDANTSAALAPTGGDKK